MNERIGQDGKHPLNRTKEVSVNVVPSADANNINTLEYSPLSHVPIQVRDHEAYSMHLQ
jgi:hypothetical protein